jgi:acetoacetyl-CoA synthetase
MSSRAAHQSDRPPYVPRIDRYQDWLQQTHGLSFARYEDLWQWSVDEAPAFWQSLWDFEDFRSPTPHEAVISDPRMPGARWFAGAQVNYAQRVFRHVEAAQSAGMPAIVSDNELGEARTLSWPELRRQVASLALRLEDLGVQPGDRVAAYLPNVPEAAVAFLACCSIGAVWTVCAPDMGTQAVTDRFAQVTPRVLIAALGVHFGGKPMDRSAVVQGLCDSLPTVEHLIALDSPHAEPAGRQALLSGRIHTLWGRAVERRDEAVARFQPRWLPFDHALWIVYSSGTTGLPKALVHGHGGVLMMGASANLHNDIGASYQANSWGERFHWFSSTGWVMWNSQIGGLVNGATICIFDGSPGGPKAAPDWTTLWRFAARHKVTAFGAGAAFYAACMKAGVDLKQCGDLSRIRLLGATGSPLAEDVQRWGTAQFDAIGTPDIWWNNLSGGTDFVGAFVSGLRGRPTPPGGLACRALGCAVYAWNEAGEPVTDQVGELVCTHPLPSMPLYLWGDVDKARYLSSYFDVYPGVWRHGDWIQVKADGSCVIYGRSDATLNRHGLRLGTSEIYTAVEALDEVLDSMVIDLEYLGQDSRMILFVVLRAGMTLDAALQGRIKAAISQAVSPRFVPDVMLQAPEIPRTLSGKKQEVPIKKAFLGQPLAKVVNPDAMANPGCLPWYAAQAELALKAAAAAKTA